MLDFTKIQELPRELALAIPVAVLLTLLVLLMAGRRRRKAARKFVAPAEARAGEANGTMTMAMFDSAAVATRANGALSSPSIAAPADAKTRLAEAQRRISATNETVDAQRLSTLYLDLADAQRDLGDEKARMTSLRSAAGIAALHGAAQNHARARLELADAAVTAGDMISACEHWQLARAALLEAGDKEQSARVDQRMRDLGCPTDWVLTDF
ncbi:MAG: hypothetical protein ACKVP4_04430 [Hyphomicrobium sp.]